MIMMWILERVVRMKNKWKDQYDPNFQVSLTEMCVSFYYHAVNHFTTFPFCTATFCSLVRGSYLQHFIYVF